MYKKAAPTLDPIQRLRDHCLSLEHFDANTLINSLENRQPPLQPNEILDIFNLVADTILNNYPFSNSWYTVISPDRMAPFRQIATWAHSRVNIEAAEKTSEFAATPLPTLSLGSLGLSFETIDWLKAHGIRSIRLLIRKEGVLALAPRNDNEFAADYSFRKEIALKLKDAGFEKWLGQNVGHIDVTKLDDSSLTDWKLTKRTTHCLSNARIDSLALLTCRSKGELLNIRNLGTKSLDEIEEFLRLRGLSLAPSR